MHRQRFRISQLFLPLILSSLLHPRQRIGISQLLLPLILSSLLFPNNATRIPKGPEITTLMVNPQHHGPPQPRHGLSGPPQHGSHKPRRGPSRPPQHGPPKPHHGAHQPHHKPLQHGSPQLKHKTPQHGPPQPRHKTPKINLPFTTPNPAMHGKQADAQPPKHSPKTTDPVHPTPAQDPSSSNMDGGDLSKEFLCLHNAARRDANLPPLVWDVKLEQYAKQYALKRGNANCGDLIHSDGPYGENLFWGGGPDWKPKDAVNCWMGEQKFYDPNANECIDGQMCGHYTQIVWRDSCRLGCVLQKCKNSDTFIICNYDPPGNYVGEKPFLHYDH